MLAHPWNNELSIYTTSGPPHTALNAKLASSTPTYNSRVRGRKGHGNLIKNITV